MTQPNDVIIKLAEYRRLHESSVAHASLSDRGLMDRRTKTKLISDAARAKAQLINMIGENPVAHALLGYIMTNTNLP